jgi:hypothetical protein
MKFAKQNFTLSPDSVDKACLRWAKLHTLVMKTAMLPESEVLPQTQNLKFQIEKLCKDIHAKIPIQLRLRNSLIHIAKKKIPPFTLTQLHASVSRENPQYVDKIMYQLLDKGAVNNFSYVNSKKRTVTKWSFLNHSLIQPKGLEYLSYLLDAIELKLQIYRTEDNRVFCGLSEIEFAGPKMAFLKTPPFKLRTL